MVVNKGTKYEEKLDNYYSGKMENLEHNPKRSLPRTGMEIQNPWRRETTSRHLDLASGAKMDKLPDKNGNVTKTDCVLLAKGLKLEWNYDAENLVKGDLRCKNQSEP